ncbi:hypothetical protein ASC64_12645 [Nocardioides sp. Root122]|uniref:hypothetical protein n=1 Tax=Nocardioides TaxID=1839 RepID=UPI0007031297|nr:MULTISPECIES: hypothetical protein [Nocardioides]KQV65754.1 hypothetical protein ASC64_12645 [Nocardioides sp. Root122]MCK9823339.1 hypothetical protein [Nocardioides cavernae]
MSDLDRLDRAFESLTRDLAHAPSPGAAAAVTTARRRRRTRVGAVALAALVVVGAGVAAPRLHMSGDVAGGAGGAPLDAAALEAATQGWLTGWEPWERYSPKGGGGFALPACFATEDGRTKEPGTGGGISRFLGDDFAIGQALFTDYPDAATAQEEQEAAYGACTGATTIEVDGTEVRHVAVAPSDADTAMTDVWTTQVGARRLTFEVGGRAGVAPPDVVDRVAEAVVAGLRSGEVQESFEDEPDAPAAVQVPQLPEVMDSDLTDALAGWRASTRRDASGVPNAPCLSVEASEGALASSSSGTPRGVTWTLGGFTDEETARHTADRMLEEVRGCADMTVRTLANGTILATYEDDDGHGAVWLGAVGDRVGVVAVDAAPGPAPEGVDEAVAEVLDGWLQLPWR